MRNPLDSMSHCGAHGIYYSSGRDCPACEADELIARLRLMVPEEDGTLEDVVNAFENRDEGVREEFSYGPEDIADIGSILPDAEESLGEETDAALKEVQNDNEIDEAPKEDEEGTES